MQALKETVEIEKSKSSMDNSDVHMVYVLLDGVGDLPHPDLDGKNTT